MQRLSKVNNIHKKLGLFSVLFFLMVMSIAVIKLPSLEFESDILALFPDSGSAEGDAELAREHAQQLMSDYISNRLFLLVSAPELIQAKSIGENISKLFLEQSVIKAVDLEQDSNRLDKLLTLYRQFSPNLLSQQDRNLIDVDPDSYVSRRLRSIFLSPASLGSESFVIDPFGATESFVTSISELQGSRLVFDEGVLYVEDHSKYYVLLQVALRDSAFSLSVQEKVIELIKQSKALVAQSPNADLLVNGALLFADSGSTQAKTEISTVGLGSLLGIFILLAWAFRSVPVLFLSTIPIALGVLTGVLACQLVFGRIHIVAMVFGASLIGVSIDYTLHFLMARVAMSTGDVPEGWGPKQGVKRILSGLTLGFVTSASAYGSFVFSGFPGFQQIALFSCVGLFAAYLVVVGIFPFLLAKPHTGVSHQGLFVLCQLCLKKYRSLYRLPVMLPLVLLMLVFFMVGINMLKMSDDIRVMQKPDVTLITAHKQFQELTGQKTAYPFFLVSGNNPEILLQRLEDLHSKLEPLVDGAMSLAQWLPSIRLQQQNQILFKKSVLADDHQSSRLREFLDRLNVQADIRQMMLEGHNARIGQFLDFEQAYSVVESVIQFPTYFMLNDQHYALVLLKSAENPRALLSIAQQSEGVDWVDQIEQTNSLLKRFRVKSTWLLVFAYLGILTLLSLRYGILGSIQVVLPPLLATLSTLALFGVLGMAINVFNIMALLLVLGIGIDYSLFLRESKGHAHETLFAISLSGITTILSFGLLALSQTQAISSFGGTILVGIFCCYFFSPLVVSKSELMLALNEPGK